MDSSDSSDTVQKNKIQMVGVGGGCFPKYSRVPHTRSTRDKFIFYPPPTPTLYSWSMNHMFIAAYTQGSVPTTIPHDYSPRLSVGGFGQIRSSPLAEIVAPLRAIRATIEKYRGIIERISGLHQRVYIHSCKRILSRI